VAFAIGGAFGLPDEVRERAARLVQLAPWTLPHELARLVQDTAVAPVGSRSDGQPRMIAFAADEITVDVEVTGGPDDHRLTGVVDGPVSELSVQTPVATYAVEVDAQGRFRATQLEGSLLRLTMATGSGRRVTTPWVRLDR
jgi:hypothetical protein